MNIDPQLAYPPTSNQIELELEHEPVSLQSKSPSKKQLQDNVRRLVVDGEYYLSGEVEVEILWHVQEHLRYRSVHSPDIDNILKPIIDALSGVDGILINDCQVQSVRCSWIDTVESQSRLTIYLRFHEDDFLKKKVLEWIQISDNLCMPWYSNIEASFKKEILSSWRRSFELSKKLEELAGYGIARQVLPVVQPFHRARLKGFVIKELEEVERELLTEGPD